MFWSWLLLVTYFVFSLVRPIHWRSKIVVIRMDLIRKSPKHNDLHFKREQSNHPCKNLRGVSDLGVTSKIFFVPSFRIYQIQPLIKYRTTRISLLPIVYILCIFTTAFALKMYELDPGCLHSNLCHHCRACWQQRYYHHRSFQARNFSHTDYQVYQNSHKYSAQCHVGSTQIHPNQISQHPCECTWQWYFHRRTSPTITL